jgi:hypothetical protein
LKQDRNNGARGAQGSGRISYKEAGAAQRAAWDRAMAAEIPTAKGTRPLNCTELRVLNAVFHFTTTYSKLEDRRSIGQIAEVAGHHAKSTATALKVLDGAGIALYKPGGRSRGHVSTIGLPPASQDVSARDLNFTPERGASNGSPYEVERGASNDSPSIQKGESLGSEKGSDSGPFRGASNDYPREKKYLMREELLLPSARESEEEETTPSSEQRPSGAVAKEMNAEETSTTPFTTDSELGEHFDHSLAGGDVGAFLGSPQKRERAEEPGPVESDHPAAERVRAHLTAVGYREEVVTYVVRQLHDKVEAPEKWADEVARKAEQEMAAARGRATHRIQQTYEVLDEIHDNQKAVAEQKERGFKIPDWRKQLEREGISA